MTSKRSPLPAAYAAITGVAILLGLLVASISWQLSVVVLVAVAGVLGLGALRVAVRPDVRADRTEPEVVEDNRFRLARIAYYLGAATIGLLTVRPALGFTLSDWIFLCSLALVVVAMLVHRISPRFMVPRSVAVGVVVFAVGGLLASRYAVAPYESGLVVVRMLYLTLAWFWLGTVVLQTRKHVETAIAAWVLSAAVSTGGAIVQFVYGDVIPGGVAEWGRYSGFADHVNHLGGIAATSFVMALVLAVDGSSARSRALGTVAAGVIAVGLVLSGSVGGLLAATIGAVVWLALRGVSLRLILGLGAIVATGFVVMSTTGTLDETSPVDRIERVTSSEQAVQGTGGTLYTRIETWERAWERIAEQPLVGVGLDPESSVAALDFQTVHNMILSVWLTAGILGLVGAITLIVGAVGSGIRTIGATVGPERSLVAGLLASLVAFVEFGMGEPILFVRYGWFPTALLIALRAQQIRAAREQWALDRRPAPRYELAPTR